MASQRVRFAVSAMLLVVSGIAYAQYSTGTGFFVSTDGHLITCYHVIEASKEIVVRDSAGTVHRALVVNVDRKNDLALLSINRRSPALPIARDNSVRRGSEAITVGFPLIDLQGQAPKVTNGIVSSLSGSADDPTTMQITNPVQPGNSGGPLVNLEGNVIGVVSSKLNALAVANKSGDITQNVNYAIKALLVSPLVATSSSAVATAPRARNQRFSSIAELTDYVERATVLVIAQRTTSTMASPASITPPKPLLPVPSVSAPPSAQSPSAVETPSPSAPAAPRVAVTRDGAKILGDTEYCIVPRHGFGEVYCIHSTMELCRLSNAASIGHAICRPRSELQ